MDTQDMLDWRIHCGEAAVESHTGEIMNGQETEPFKTQAMDAIVNILHAIKANMDEDREKFDDDEPHEFDVDRFLLAATVSYKEESGDA
jgi:hypothetical protein